MKESDQATFVIQLQILSRIFHKELTDDVIDVYWNAVSRYAKEHFLGACRHIAQTYTYFPKPVELRLETVDCIPKLAEAIDPPMTALEKKRSVVMRRYICHCWRTGEKQSKPGAIKAALDAGLDIENAREMGELIK